MSKPAFPTKDEFNAMRARCTQAKHVPSGLALGDFERLQLFADLDRLLDIVAPAVEESYDRPADTGLEGSEEEPSRVE